ncbi:TPA: hypothetical protein RXI34_000413 [Staphylococcus aureus]|nr:hypothetical protein [Staphylococcus aureus]
MQVGGAPTQRNWIPNFYRQCKLAGPQHREIGFPISTDNASWGGTTIKKYFFLLKLVFLMHEFYSCIPIFKYTLAVANV